MGGVVENEDKVPFEEALNKSGFGLYSYLLLSVSGLVVIAVVCTAYGNTIIVPTSACELQTTTAQRGVLAAVPVVGLIVGGILWGYLADVFGRRLTLIISLISSAVVNSLASISVNWIMLMILQFIATLLSSGQYSMAMTMLSESVPMVKRNIVVLLVGSIFLLAQGIMAVLAIPIIPLTFSYELPTLGIYWNSWRTLLLVYSAPSILSALWLFFMYESPKFLFAKGRETEALKILKNIHRLNNLGSKSEYNVQSFEADTTTSSISKSAKEQILPLFKSPLLKNTIILTLLFIFQQIGSFQVWLPTITNKLVEILETGEGSNLTLCGILRSSISAPPDPDAVPCSLNVTSLLIVLAVGAMQSVTNAIISIVINRIGRRNMVMFVAAFCGLCGIIVNLVPNAIGSAVMFFILLIGIVNIGLYTAMAVALFPTYLRALAVAFTMTGSRIGAFASVQILNVLLESNCEVGFYVYSAVFASSAVIALFLANDRSP
ncbi:synaptic vesicle 2-related protein-like isoform X1 [Nymphalis io]|uniref:synaptic vesicle 2-related protein-like isoform X1 n=1 Tax=Inachis io TaxID=171585 RepID=UPI0021674557|nr:synaptic vesicle 2-related protein-like isoform X1 [Nymphalis io]